MHNDRSNFQIFRYNCGYFLINITDRHTWEAACFSLLNAYVPDSRISYNQSVRFSRLLWDKPLSGPSAWTCRGACVWRSMSGLHAWQEDSCPHNTFMVCFCFSSRFCKLSAVDSCSGRNLFCSDNVGFGDRLVRLVHATLLSLAFSVEWACCFALPLCFGMALNLCQYEASGACSVVLFRTVFLLSNFGKVTVKLSSSFSCICVWANSPSKDAIGTVSWSLFLSNAIILVSSKVNVCSSFTQSLQCSVLLSVPTCGGIFVVMLAGHVVFLGR